LQLHQLQCIVPARKTGCDGDELLEVCANDAE
jgi:hypothetical protein